MTRPRDEKVRALKRVLLAAWFPDRVSELDDPANEPWINPCTEDINSSCIYIYAHIYTC